MNALVLILAIVIPYPLCLFRMKKYHISFWKMMLINLLVTLCGIVGAALGAAVSGGTIWGKRLYGLMIADTLSIFVLSRPLKLSIADMGDFIAPPIMAVCFASKLDCIYRGCCYGIIIKKFETAPALRFPSAIVEMSIWAVLTIVLVLLERSKKTKGLLWPIGMIGFGIFRFITDYFRGAPNERAIFFLGLSGGALWSLITVILGVIYLAWAIRKSKKTALETYEISA